MILAVLNKVTFCKRCVPHLISFCSSHRLWFLPIVPRAPIITRLIFTYLRFDNRCSCRLKSSYTSIFSLFSILVSKGQSNIYQQTWPSFIHKDWLIQLVVHLYRRNPIVIWLHQFQSFSQVYAYTVIPSREYLLSCIISSALPLLRVHVSIPCSVFTPKFGT